MTLKDVAARVGVTPAAVSMALAGSSRISAPTTEKIRQAADELGYVGSSAARALRSKRSGAVALVVPNSTQHVFGHNYFMHVLTGVAQVTNEHDAQVLISTNSSEESGLTAYERVMHSRTADGAIVTSASIADPNIERLVASGLPVVLIGNYPGLAASSVGIDDVSASRLVTEHLIEVHGRRRLLHVTGPLDHQTALDRRVGFFEAVRAHGIERDARVVEGDFSEQSGADATASAFDAHGLDMHDIDIDGIVFANDDMAFGGVQTLRRRGVEVPTDVSVVGFDDFGLSRVTQPGITTVHVPAEAMARTAAGRLFEQLDASEAVLTRDELPVSLVLRESCGCPRVTDALNRD